MAPRSFEFADGPISEPQRASSSSPAIMALALDASLHVADIAQIYSNVGRDYTLSELCIMSRFRPITPEDKGGVEPIVSTACVSHQRQDTAAAAAAVCARVRPIQP